MTEKQKRALVKQWKAIERNEPYALRSRHDPIINFVSTIKDV